MGYIGWMERDAWDEIDGMNAWDEVDGMNAWDAWDALDGWDGRNGMHGMYAWDALEEIRGMGGMGCTGWTGWYAWDGWDGIHEMNSRICMDLWKVDATIVICWHGQDCWMTCSNTLMILMGIYFAFLVTQHTHYDHTFKLPLRVQM